MVGWHHRLNRHEFEQTLGAGDGQGGLACCSQSMGSQRVRHDLATHQQHQYMHTCIYIIGFPCGSVVENLPAMQELSFNPCVGKIP